MTLETLPTKDLLDELAARFHTTVFSGLIANQDGTSTHFAQVNGNQMVALGLCQYAGEQIHKNMREEADA